MASTPEIIRILIIDDDEDDFLITSDYIKSIEGRNFVIDWCFRYAEALERISRKEYDIYFVDYRLGAKTGLDLLKDALAMHCEEPIILLTGKGNRRVDEEAMEVGAFDYLIKAELNTEKIERCIRYSLDRAASVKALRSNEQKYRTIFERSKDAVFITDMNLNFRDMNLAMSELLGYSHEELLRRSLYDLIEGDALKNEIRQAIEAIGEVDDIEIVIVDQVKEKKVCILSLSRQNENDGDDLQGIIHDITNLKRAEKITLQAEKLAAAGRLVRTLAHEVRNPLSNIQMSVEQLESSEVSADNKVFLEIIQRNGKRINDLITELLDSSRPTEMIYKPVALQEIVDETIKIAIDRATLKQIAITVDYPAEPWTIHADKEKLKIAFLNIIINATEAISSTDGEIAIGFFQIGNSYRLQIRDNGCGISQENLAKLFEPYFTSKRNGMGLGLASTLNIIQSHRGVVDVKSQVDVGTTFFITFPKAALPS
jgi:PAS domain S-box-containing protein